MEEITPHQSKALDFDHSVSLRANAGSGKTFVLAKRYLQIITEGKVPVQKIAAITFTDKAAGELYKRIAKEIDDKIENSDIQGNVSELEKIRRQLVSANISTIHSFCINILTEFPVEAEIDANFTPIDSTTSSELLELSVEETIRQKLEDNTSEDIRDLIRLLSSKRALVTQLQKMIDKRSTVLRLENEIYKKSVQQIADFFHETFVKYFDIIFLPQVKILTTDLKKINDEVLANNSENDFALTAEALIEELKTLNNADEIINIVHRLKDEIFTKSISIKARGYFANKLRTGFENEVKKVERILNDLLRIEIDENSKDIGYQLAVTGKYLIDIFNDILFLYNEKKKELGYLDYEDILLKTQKLLLVDDVKKYLSDKFSYLMVDEYQDTNELQYNIFMPILDNLKKGNLFVVGDEKQSIYRFRDAELEVFSKTNVDIVESSSNESLITLPDSFRMEPEICLFTNVLFRNLFSNPNSIYNEVEHSDLICAKMEYTEGKISVIVAEEESELTEADLVCRQILSLINDEKGNLDWKDIAILVRKRSSFTELEKQSLKYNIPIKIIGGTGFYQRQSIYDVYNYFSFLLDTNNDAALIGILRSPFFSISDVKIFGLSLKSGTSYWEKLQNSNTDDEELSVALNQLNENLQIVGQRDIISLLRKIFRETNFIAVLASRHDADQELANIEKLLKLTNTFTNQGFKTLYDYVDYLKDSISNLEDEAQAGLAEQLNAVNILTLHQAKGLEFPIVFLYNSHEESKIDTVKSKSITIDKSFGLLTKLPLNNDYFEEYKSAPVVSVRDYVERRKNLAEIKRLFYVGITRAEKYLFISASSKGKNKFPAASFISLLFEGLSVEDNVENIFLSENLTFLIKDNNNYKNAAKKINVTIPIIRHLDLIEKTEYKHEQTVLPKKFLLDKIFDKSEGEIISATKVSTYAQCPLKYNFIYNFGYSKLSSDLKRYDSKNTYTKYAFDGFDGEDILTVEFDESPYLKEHSEIKGKIIHKVLQKEIEINNLENFITNEVNYSYEHLFKSEEIKQSFLEELRKTLAYYYSSDEVEYLNGFTNFKNEMEIYLKEDEYFLFGIIDKIIVADKKIIIVDYKTDAIDKNN
ncbi:MAG: UvrD-helicase domain-containing protein [Ignavibacterium sp.]|nr:MAG: UvrD-helicase domain-containing protein [Ignavibacterium sp.]